MNATLQLSTQTVAWLANHSRTRQFVGSVWDKLTELERAGHHPGAIDALRHVLIYHQPTPAGRCRTCKRWRSRRRPFPCVVWHQIRNDLLGLFAGGDRHRQGPWWTDTGEAAPSRLANLSGTAWPRPDKTGQ